LGDFYKLCTIYILIPYFRKIIRIVHPDKLKGATISEELEAKELFTIINQAFEEFKQIS